MGGSGAIALPIASTPQSASETNTKQATQIKSNSSRGPFLFSGIPECLVVLILIDFSQNMRFCLTLQHPLVEMQVADFLT